MVYLDKNGMNLTGIHKEKYLEKLILAIDELNKHLKKTDEIKYFNNILYNSKVSSFLDLLRLCSKENNYAGGNFSSIDINASSGFPDFYTVHSMSRELSSPAENLDTLIRSKPVHQDGKEPRYSAEDLLQQTTMDAAKRMLSGYFPEIEKTSVRDFLHYSRLCQLKEFRKEFENMINDEETFFRDIYVPKDSNDPAKKVYTIGQFKLQKRNWLWTLSTISFTYKRGFKDKFFPLLDEKDGTFSEKGSLQEALASRFRDNVSLAIVYSKLADIDQIQPLHISEYSLGPFYQPMVNRAPQLDKVFLDRPESFILQYSQESIIIDGEHLLKGNKYSFKEEPLNYTVVCPSNVGIDFHELLGATSVVDVLEIRPEKINAIEEKYENANKRFASEYVVK